MKGLLHQVAVEIRKMQLVARTFLYFLHRVRRNYSNKFWSNLSFHCIVASILH